MVSFIPVELIIGLIMSLPLFIAGLQQLWRSSSKKDKHQHEKKLPLPPGRLGLPFIGETLELWRASLQGLPWKFMDDRISAYGETFKTRLLGFPAVVLASPLGNKAAFSNVHISLPPSILAVLGTESVIGHVGAHATLLRKAVTMLMRPESLQRYTNRVDLIILGFIREHFEAKSEVILGPLMKKLTFSIACEVLLGLADIKEQDRLFLHFDTMVKGMMQMPINIPGTRYHKAVAESNAIRKQFQSWINERKRDIDAGSIPEYPDILSGVLAYMDKHGKPLSDKEVKDNILFLLFANYDAATVVATMTCKYLASDPHIMDEVYRENKAMAASKAPGELLNWRDIQKMKLSWRVVQESMRLAPPAQLSFREAQEDMSFDGFRIPKSWKIVWSPNSTHRNPKYFPNPDKFDPSRFEGAGPAPFTFVPFGGGPRMCPGNELARMVILMILHRLITRFSWTLKDPNEAVVVDVVPFPVNGLPILLQPRIA